MSDPPRHARLLALLAFSSCVTGQPADPAAARYDRMMRYVPPRMESLMFHTPSPNDVLEQATLLLAASDPAARQEILSEVYAGRKFRSNGFGAGDFEGVIVTRYRVGVPTGWDADKGAPTVVRGRPAFGRHGGGWRPAENWWVQVEPDILLYATRRDLLEEALRADGATTVAAAASLGWSAGIRWDADCLIVRRFDRTNTEDRYSPFGTEPLAHWDPHTVDFDGFLVEMHDAAGADRTLRIRARTSAAAKARGWFDYACTGLALGPGRFTDGEWSIEQTLDVDAGLWSYHMLLMFGCNAML